MVRRGWGRLLAATSACSSASSGRRPSMVTVMQVPGTGSACREVNSPDGSGTETMPCSAISKQPTSSAGPYRFLVARTSRNPECRSPSKLSTTSTRCSIIRGPAIAPSLVTCPTMITAMPRRLATRTSAPVTSRTWVTPPGEPSASAVPTVCTESSTISDGWTSSMCPSTVPRSVSAAR